MFVILEIFWIVVLTVQLDISLCVVCVIRVAFFGEASAFSFPVILQWPGIHSKTIILFLPRSVGITLDTSELQLFWEVLHFLLLV